MPTATDRCPRCGRVYDPLELTDRPPAAPINRARGERPGSWPLLAIVTLVLIAAAAGALFHHRDAGSLLAAVVLLLVCGCIWRRWIHARIVGKERR